MQIRNPPVLNRALPMLVAGFVMLAAATTSGRAAPPAAKQAGEVLVAAGVAGGLVVHLGCGDGKLTAALGGGDGVVVHGLDRDPANVEAARQHVESQGLYGQVSVDRWEGDRLPYIDDVVNLVVAQGSVGVRKDEILRVLAPGGVACVQVDGGWSTTVKPQPREIDQWTHFLHDASGNAVAHDALVGPPRHVQWLADPPWARNHHHLASTSAVVTAGGRLFYINDEAPPASMEVPGDWHLVARDAFSGVLLWKRPIPVWEDHMRRFRSGPVDLPRRLVALDGRVYATLGLEAPVTALDTASGKALVEFPASEGTEEIVCSEGTLLVMLGGPEARRRAAANKRRGEADAPGSATIKAYDATSGKLRWEKTRGETGPVMPLTLAAAEGRAFFQNPQELVCLDLADGHERWRSARSSKLGKPFFAPTLVVAERVVLSSDGKTLEAFAADTGKPLWSCPSKPNFNSPSDVFVIDGLVWLGPEFAAGRDLHTGEVKKQNVAMADLWTAGHHHRCYREKATDRFILTGKRGIEFFDLAGDVYSRNNWVRGLCQYGILPANGLIYAPPHACGCYQEAKLYGFWALAAERGEERGTRGEHPPRLQRGPAFNQIQNPPSTIRNAPDWPTFRHDPLRSGSTEAEVPLPLKSAWQAEIGGRLTQPVVAGGTVFVASVDRHRVAAVDAGDGAVRWTFTAGGRVDSAPTVHGGLVLFGCCDGRVYCLRASDGELVWRFLAAPEDRRTVARDQVESVWPVHGSVLVEGGVAYCAAGRSSYLDGGIALWGLDPATGEVVCRTRYASGHAGLDRTPAGERTGQEKIAQNTLDHKTRLDPDKSSSFSMGGVTTDVLTTDGTSIYLRHVRFDRELTEQPGGGRHLVSSSKLLDDTEVHRSHWLLGTGKFRRIPVAYSWIANRPGGAYGSQLLVPYGMLLSFDGTTVWGVRRVKGYTLFAEGHEPLGSADVPLDFQPVSGKKPDWQWTAPLAMRPRAMVRAGGTLLVGGMAGIDEAADLPAAYRGEKGGFLRAVAATDGSTVSDFPLDSPPVWDGMSVASGRLYVATQDGKLRCLGGIQ